MMKYIYIDDEQDTSTLAIRDGLNDVNIVHVDLEPPQKFETQSENLINKLNDYNGIILDLRLDDNPKSEASYTAPPLAQALRSYSSTNNGQADCPIILCSTDAKIKKSYKSDQSSHDLFDYKFLKDHEPNWPKIVNKLDSLAKGYKFLAEMKDNLSEIIQRNFNDLDIRIFERFSNPEIKFPPHEYAKFVIKDLLGQPGPLINEKFLAAKLGIDSQASPDWQKLIDTVFHDAAYMGVFSKGWRRWWIDIVMSVFKKITGKRLSALKASERVHILSQVTGIVGITAATPLPRCISDNYWTICEFYKKPLDPLEGFKISTIREPKPWQDPRYLSIDAAVERKGYTKGLIIHSSEKDRLEKIKDQLREKEK